MKEFMLLGSRIALGVYVPALSLKKQLEARGCRADLVCLEDLYMNREEVIEETKKSYHRDFRLAKLSYRLPTRNSDATDPCAARRLQEDMIKRSYDGVVTFSGFWAGFLNELAEADPYYEERIYAVHMDASSSLSWKGTEHGCIQDILMYDLDSNSVRCMLEPGDEGRTHEHRILVHGGGWGIGDYGSKMRLLNEMGYPLDIIIYYPEELDETDTVNEYYMLDPEWKPDEDRDEYPRLLRFRDGEWIPYGGDIRANNPLRELMKRDEAVLSKPGGGTVSDSLVTATPVIFAEELAYYERDNRLLWTGMGLGMDFDDFAAADDRDSELRNMRRRLQKIRKDLPCVIEEIL